MTNKKVHYNFFFVFNKSCSNLFPKFLYFPKKNNSMEKTKHFKDVIGRNSVNKLNPQPISLKIEPTRRSLTDDFTRGKTFNPNLQKLRYLIISSFKNLLVMFLHFFRKGCCGDKVGERKKFGSNFKSAFTQSNTNMVKLSFIKFIRKLMMVQKAIRFLIERSPFRQIKDLRNRDFQLISDKTYFVGTSYIRSKNFIPTHTGVFKKTFRKIRRFSRKSCSQMRMLLSTLKFPSK